MCMQIHTTIFWSGNGILFNTLQISPACSMHIGLPKQLGTLQYFTILAIQGNGEKMPQPSVDNHLNFFFSFFWQADLNTNIEDESRSFYGVSSQYESPENMVITCSTKVCSFGKQVVEKVEVRSRHLGARFSLAAVLSLQVFPSCLCISRQNISHASCQGDGCHRLLSLRHAGVRSLSLQHGLVSGLHWRSGSVCCFSLISQFLRRCKYVWLLALVILWGFLGSKGKPGNTDPLFCSPERWKHTSNTSLSSVFLNRSFIAYSH